MNGVTTVANNSFERLRSRSVNRAQSAEERAFAEMQKALQRYEELTGKLILENSALAGRIDALEQTAVKQRKMHVEELKTVKQEALLEVEKLRTAVAPILAERADKHLTERRNLFLSMLGNSFCRNPQQDALIRKASIEEVEWYIATANRCREKPVGEGRYFRLHDILWDPAMNSKRTLEAPEFYLPGSTPPTWHVAYLVYIP